MAEVGEEKQALEQQLERAVSARVQHFKDQADSLTLESVRRLLEKDLGLEKFALDAHKRFIRHYLEKIMEAADESNSNPTTANMDKDVQLSEDEEKVLPKQQEAKNEPKKASPGNEETMEDSPIMGVLTPKSEVGTQSSLSESTIKKAILERADYLHANSSKISLAGVRRLLEEDLGLDKKTLDAYKDFISEQIDQVLKGGESVKDVKKKVSENMKSRKLKVSHEDTEEESGASQSESDEVSEKVKSRKEAAPRRNIKKSEQPKKRKTSENADIDVRRKKANKVAKKEEDNNSDEDGSLSGDGQSRSSIERQALRKEKPAPTYGKKVENLKSIIKACGMSVPPNIYKKAKQGPEDKRETILVKELEGILSKEGLSKNPTEKEIKDCRKKKERARELEGIDMSNIISSSRRRSTFSFAAPEKPLVHAKKDKKDKVDAKDSKQKENNDKDINDDNKEETKEEEKEAEEEEKEEEKAEEEEEEEVEEEEEEDDGDDEEQDDDDESEEFDEDDNEDSD